MPRRARLTLAGIPLHIIQRGNNRSPCFFTQKDYRYYLRHLEIQALEFGCDIHAYCLMTNHVHLLLTPRESDSASLMMKFLGQRFVQYINRSYKRSGTLWEGRFRSCLAQDAHYVLTCYRYIELNPVRANMVVHPRDYPWSSYHQNGEGKQSSLITEHPSFVGLAESERDRRAVYRALIDARLTDQQLRDIRSATNGNYVFGSAGFQREIGSRLNRRVMPARAGRPRKGD